MPKLNFLIYKKLRDVKPLAPKCQNTLYLIFKVKCKTALLNQGM